MAGLPESFHRYFEALRHGLDALLPPLRVQNKVFLLSLMECLEDEPRLTEPDLDHLKTVLAMADKVPLPPIRDAKTLCEAEAFLLKALPGLEKKEVRLALRWAFLLLARHGRVDADLATVELWIRVWRLVQTFHPVEQGFVSDVVRWMREKAFSPTSIGQILLEYRRFRAWMVARGISSLGEIEDLDLQRYLLQRACGDLSSSKQKFLGSLRTIFHYYKEAIDGGYRIPEYTVKAPRTLGVNVSATGEEIDKLWDALLAGNLPAMAGFMLALVLGYGLTLKALPLLRITERAGRLVYRERRPSRCGVWEREIFLDLDCPWLVSLWASWLLERQASPDCTYLFTSGHGDRRKRPVSVEYCQRQVKRAVSRVLGYPIPVNHLERGALKRLARTNSLSWFMVLTSQVPKTRLNRMMIWLNQNSPYPERDTGKRL